MDDDTSAWARVGHLLAPRARATLTDEHAVMVIEVPGDPTQYVQWHGEPGGEFYAEVSSGAYGGTTLTPAQAAQLRALGWAAPGAGWGADAVRNWSRHWPARVDLYAVVRLTVRTLREVFHADPHQLLEAL